MKQFLLFLLLAGTLTAAPISTCTIYRWSQQTQHEIAVQNTGSSSCSADFDEQITFPFSGATGSVIKSAGANFNVADSPDENGFYMGVDGDGYMLFASAAHGGNGLTTVEDVFYPEGSGAELYAFGAAEASGEFYRRAFTITNPRAHTAGFEVAPIIECGSMSFGSGDCFVDWEVGSFLITNSTFTIEGTAGVAANSSQDAQEANLLLHFPDPRSYTLTVRDAQGNIIPESEWLTSTVATPEPLSLILTAAGLLFIWRFRKATGSSAQACTSRRSQNT